MESRFHLSLPCSSVETTKKFYVNTLGAKAGRSAQNWVDINLAGHQITFTKAGKFNFNNPNYVFEGKILPSFHYGVIVSEEDFKKIYQKLKDQDLELVTKATFLEDKTGEHKSFFIQDPNDYMIEFKCFKQKDGVFRS